jgi:hypothetical protein
MAEFGGDHSRRQTVFVVTTTTFVLASCFVAVRLVSRFAILGSRTADYWFMIVAWVSDYLQWCGIALMCGRDSLSPSASRSRLIMAWSRDWGDMMSISRQNGFLTGLSTTIVQGPCILHSKCSVQHEAPSTHISFSSLTTPPSS